MTPPDPHPFHVALIEPQIPGNTGAIGRVCAATGCRLHLVGQLGFSLDDRALRRAGLDYWPHVPLSVHPELGAFWAKHAHRRAWLLTVKARRTLWEARFERGDLLVFGRETVGLPDDVLDRYPDRWLRIPQRPVVRSHNLANAASIVVYEALRQIGWNPDEAPLAHPPLRR